MTKKTKLLPCPVCGKEPKVLQINAKLGTLYDANCLGTDKDPHLVGTKAYGTKEEAEKAWNKIVQRAFSPKKKIYLVVLDIRKGDQQEPFYTRESAKKWIEEYIKEYENDGWEQNNCQVWENGRGEFINLVELNMNKLYSPLSHPTPYR
jgi:hypothetical protein